MRRILEEEGALAIEVPVMRLQPILAPAALATLRRRIASGSWDDLVFTSANAVDLALPPFPGGRAPRVFAIGPGTARRCRERGWQVETLPQTFIAEELAESVRSAGVSGHRLLLARAEDARPILRERLLEAGAEVEVLEIYRMVAESSSAPDLARALSDPHLDAVTFASGSAVRCFRELYAGALPGRILVACIGPITAAAARQAGVEPGLVAAEHSLPGLVRELGHRLGPLSENGPGDELS